MTHTEPDAIPAHTMAFTRNDYHGPRTLNINTDGGTIRITVGNDPTPSAPVTTITHTPAEGWHIERTTGEVIRFARSATPGTGVWREKTLTARSDSREFVTDADPELVIVVQTALCHDAASGEAHVGLATYYLRTQHASDPLYHVRHAHVVCTAVEVPLACEGEAARALARFDPATLTWDGTHQPSSGNDWISDHWPHPLFGRD